MTDRPIIFSAPMVQALIEGRKTQTRRILKKGCPASRNLILPDGPNKGAVQLNYAPGNRLWVKEAWRIDGAGCRVPAEMCRLHRVVEYRADGYEPDRHAERSPIFMPRWASRLTLTVSDVRVQRLQDISEADAWAEGCRRGEMNDHGEPFPADEPDPSGIGERGWDCAGDWFADLWNSIHGPDAWDANPWVVALTFDVHRGNIDEVQP